MNFFKKKYLKVPQVSVSNIFREVGKNPFVDWIIVLIISGVVAILLILGGAYLYSEINSGNIKNQEAVKIANQKIFDQKELSAIIDDFRAKEDTTSKTKTSYKAPPDPSI